MAVDFKVNMDDERLKAIDKEEAKAVKNSNATYDTMIKNSDRYYNNQINESKAWEQKQTQLQQEQTDFAIQKIEQQQQQAEKDYIREQKGAYADWQKESNKYGANAEQMADMGMGGTGYSESSQVSMWNTYQNRVATARESYIQIKTDFDNAMTEARLQNNAVLAEIAHEAQQTRLELALNQFQYKNSLISEKASKALELNKYYDSKWQTILDQINKENQLAMQQEQFNKEYKLKQKQHQKELKLQQDRLKEEIRQFNILHPTLPAVSGSSSGGGSSSSSKGGSSSNKKKKTSSTKKSSSTHVSSSNKTHGGAGKKWSTNVNASKKGKSMIDIIMSDPKYLPAVAKKKFGLSR